MPDFNGIFTDVITLGRDLQQQKCLLLGSLLEEKSLAIGGNKPR